VTLCLMLRSTDNFYYILGLQCAVCKCRFSSKSHDSVPGCLLLLAEGWEEAEDKSGCVVHVVDLEPDTAQVVLDALQAAVFIGKLPDCPWKVSPSHWASHQYIQSHLQLQLLQQTACLSDRQSVSVSGSVTAAVTRTSHMALATCNKQEKYRDGVSFVQRRFFQPSAVCWHQSQLCWLPAW
jgi:hypothetical protein